MSDDEAEQAVLPVKPVRHAISPPKYSGEKGSNPAQHLAGFDIAARANGWDENLKLIQFPGSLIKFSLSWYLATTEKKVRNDQEWTWATLKAEFLRHGTQGLFATDLEFLLMDRKQRDEETCLEYMYAMEQLMMQIDDEMEDDKRVKYVKRGLKAENFKRVNLVPCRDMDDLTILLENLDEAIEKDRRDQQKEEVELIEEDVFKGHSAKPSEKDKALETIKELQDRLRRLELRQERSNRAPENPYDGPERRYGGRGQGYRGGYSGRYAPGNRVRQLEIEPPQGPSQVIQRDVRCYACDERGHFARDCRNRDPKNGYGPGRGAPRGGTQRPPQFTSFRQ